MVSYMQTSSNFHSLRACKRSDRRSGAIKATLEAQTPTPHASNTAHLIFLWTLILHSGESAVSRDSKYFVTTTLQNTVRVYSITPTGLTLLHAFPSPNAVSGNFPLQVCFAEGGATVVSGSDNGELRMWNLSSGRKTTIVHEECSNMALETTSAEPSAGPATNKDQPLLLTQSVTVRACRAPVTF